MEGDDRSGKARNHSLNSAVLELINLPIIIIRENKERIGLDGKSLLEVYKYMDLDPWLIGQLSRRSSSWTCCTYTGGILDFQLLISMYYIACSVSTSQATTKTKAMLMPQERIFYSRCFAADAMLEEI